MVIDEVLNTQGFSPDKDQCHRIERSKASSNLACLEHVSSKDSSSQNQKAWCKRKALVLFSYFVRTVKGLAYVLRPQVHALLVVLWGRDFILVYCKVLDSCAKRNNPDEHLILQLFRFTVTEYPLFSHFSNNALMGLTWTVPLGNA